VNLQFKIFSELKKYYNLLQ